MKRILAILCVVTAFTFNSAMAEKSTGVQKSKKNTGGSMAVFTRTSPMPLLMSIIVKNKDKLGLSEEQSAVFTQWRVENMGISFKDGNTIIAKEKAIKQAALNGKSSVDIEKMISSMLEKRRNIASNMLKCRDLIMTTLSKSQWEKLIAIYKNKNLK